MSDWYAPNQQAVRADGSGPAEEGTGGTQAAPAGLDTLTKDELMDRADELGVEYDEAWTKAKIRAAIEAG